MVRGDNPSRLGAVLEKRSASATGGREPSVAARMLGPTQKVVIGWAAMVSATTTFDSPKVRLSSLKREVVEFLAVGGATLLLYPLAVWFRQVSGLEESVYLTSMVAFYAAHVINDPHFGVTYVLFYRRVKARLFGGEFSGVQRFRYVVAGFVVPVLMIAWLAWAMRSHSAERMGQLIQVMYFLVSWHYVKQGFGVLTILSLRRGIRYAALERRLILAHCFAGWAYAFCSPSGPSYQVEESGIVYWTLGIPEVAESLTRGVFFATGLGVVFVFWRKWQRERVLPPLAPLIGFFITIWLWSVYSSFDPLMAYLIPALHSIQYLYFVYLLRKNETLARAAGPIDEELVSFAPRRLTFRFLTLGASALVLGWLAFRGGPQFLDGTFVMADPDLHGGLGATPFLAAIGTFVNIHHYFMDNVIWRRDNRETRYLTSDVQAA
jgi:hypothetical protein